MRVTTATSATLGGAMLVSAALAGCGAWAATEDQRGPDLAPVERRTLEIRADAAGSIRPVRVVEVQSKAGGEVLRMLVETGDEVPRGTLLAEIDPRDVSNALAQAEADLRVAEARLNISQSQWRRAQELYAANIITQQEYESAALDEANAQAQLARAQYTLELARERMNDVAIRAPIDGTIIQRSVEEGAIIQSATSNVSGGTTLLLMADLSEMEVRTLIDETDIGRIVPDQLVRVTVEAYPGRAFEGRVLKIEPQAVVEQNVTMFPVLIRLDNRDRLLKPGMNAEVQIEIARRENVVALPNSAVVVPRNATAAAALLGVPDDEVNRVMQANGPNSSRQNDELAAGGGDADCEALFARLQSGGFNTLTDAERNRMRECAPTMAGRMGGGAFPGGPGGAQVRPGGAGGGQGRAGGQGRFQPPTEVTNALVFVATQNGIEPRRVALGMSDWDYVEVIRGVEPGEHVVLMSVAQIQQQQQLMMERMRGRGGVIPGGGPMPGPGRGMR